MAVFAVLPCMAGSSGTMLRVQLVYGIGETVEADSVLNTPPVDPWTSFDKVQHVTFSFLWTLGSQYVFVNKGGLGERQAIAFSAGTSGAVGLAKELYDWRIGSRRYFSRRDLVADALGIAAGIAIILL